MRTRAEVPPMLVCTISRSVCPPKPLPQPCGDDAQVPVHTFEAAPSVASLVWEPSPAPVPPSDPLLLPPLLASTTAPLPVPPLLVQEPSIDPLPPGAPAAPLPPPPDIPG